MPGELQSAFRRKCNYDNALRLQLLSYVFVVIVLIMLAVDLLQWSRWSRIEGYDTFIYFDVAMLLVATAYVVTGWWRLPRSPDDVTQWDRAKTNAGLVFLLSWTASIGALEQQAASGVPTYLGGMFVLATLFYLQGRMLLLIFGASFVAYLTVTWARFGSLEPLLVQDVSLPLLLAISWIVSRVLYSTRARIFVNGVRLRELNETLELRVEQRTRELDRANRELRELLEETDRLSQYWRTLFDQVNDAIFVMEQGVVIHSNRKAHEMFRARSEELMGISPERLSPERQPDGAPSEELSRQYLQRAAQGEAMLFPWVHRRLTGELFDAEVSLSSLGDPPGRIIAAVRDIGSRRRAERALRMSEENLAITLDSIAEGVIVADARGRVTRMNPVAVRLAGHSQEEAVGRAVSELVQLEDAQTGAPLDCPVAQVCRSGEPVENNQGAILGRADAEPKRVQYSAAPMRDREGVLMGAVLVLRDVTQEHQVQEQLQQAQRLEAIGRLAGGIAHDFNNLLTAITGSAELAMMDLEEDRRAHEDLREIVNTAERASDLTRQLLAFSRRQVQSAKVLNLRHVLADLRNMLRRIIGEDVRLVMELDGETWATRMDPTHVEQIVVNLAVNARDAMPEGGDLEIRTENVVLDHPRHHGLGNIAPGAYVRLRVRDTGVGMSEDVRERIFDPFFTTKQEGKGTGLGLATVYGITRQSGGAIAVSSSPGRGTTFDVYLPSVDVGVEEERGPSLERHDRTPSATILVVEDEEAVRAVVCQTLRRSGHEVVEASSGEAALERAEEIGERLDLLVTDMVMPGINGVELSDRLLQRWPALRVLYISGYMEGDLEELIRHREASRFLQKPFRPATFLEEVNALLDEES